MARALVSVNKHKKNLIINGAFDFWQRGTSLVYSGVTGVYLADRFIGRPGGTSAGGTASRSTDVPNTSFKYSHMWTDAGGGNAHDFYLHQRIEASIIRPYIGKVMTFSCWFKNDTVAINNAVLRVYTPVSGVENTFNADPDIETQIASKTTAVTLGQWVRLSLSFTVPANAQYGLSVAVSSAVVVGAVVLKTTGVMLTPGPEVPSNFYGAGDSIQAELAMCQRYYEKSYDQDQTPSGTTSTGTRVLGVLGGVTNGNNLGGVEFAVTKRTTPSVSIIAPVSGTSGSIRHNSSDLVATVANIGQNGFSLVNGSGGTVGASSNSGTVQFIAVSEL